MTRRIIAAAFLLLPALTLAEPHPGSDAFVERAVADYGLDAADVSALLEDGAFQQRIADLMAKPAEGKPWYDYRPIFMTDQRIDEGLDFWRANEELIAQVAERYQVDPQVIVAIIGVETFYGRITGGFRVLDALTTRLLRFCADEHCEGRVVSTLEGGYDLNGLATSVAAHVKVLMERGA